MGHMRNAYNILVGKLDGKRLFGRPRCRLEDIIRMDLTEIELESVDRMHLVQDIGQWQAVMNTVMNLRVS
jgi:hypothetical protein